MVGEGYGCADADSGAVEEEDGGAGGEAVRIDEGAVEGVEVPEVDQRGVGVFVDYRVDLEVLVRDARVGDLDVTGIRAADNERGTSDLNC